MIYKHRKPLTKLKHNLVGHANTALGRISMDLKNFSVSYKILMQNAWVSSRPRSSRESVFPPSGESWQFSKHEINSKNENRSLFCTCLLQNHASGSPVDFVLPSYYLFSTIFDYFFVFMFLTNTFCSKWHARFVSWLGRASFGLEIDNIWNFLPWPWHQIFYISKIVSFRLRA